ncbi:hypothetical protein HS088_TW04G00245 [Tripterygium wilfordii]|uniref:CXXC motif containing zinc binding protein n=1 Tax=Tripterygium wilfordii TaxID=458696 RepID=A0A7J7DPS7_TRIWF|nr:CXXC motif containing zinc binding protein [Tripterygium wilfordii]KAF5748293.1 hypothetical protein HS088_TW04G00245 [Tripterygium wilfordii]
MVKYMLVISAELENLTNLQPQGGRDDPTFSYFFKVKCGNCGEVSQKATCVTLNETLPSPLGKGTTNLVQKCKLCKREGTITMVPGSGSPLTQDMSETGKFSPLMLFDCRGYEPVDFVFGLGWKVESIEGTKYEDVDLSSGEFAEYDEKGECPVMISNLRSAFNVVK